MNCPIYLGIDWVCENPPDKAWSDKLGCQCGARMPCKSHRHRDEIDEPDVADVECRLPGADFSLAAYFFAALLPLKRPARPGGCLGAKILGGTLAIDIGRNSSSFRIRISRERRRTAPF
jgi:hypothetical protein